MKITVELLEKGSIGGHLTVQQKKLLGIKNVRHPLRNFVLTNPEISEDLYQQFLSLRADICVAERKKETKLLLAEAIAIYETEKDVSKRQIVNWPFSPFVKYTTDLYSHNKCIKAMKWQLDVEQQLITACFSFTNYTLCCTFRWQDKTVTIRKEPDSIPLGIVNVEEYVNTVKANFPKVKVVVKRTK